MTQSQEKAYSKFTDQLQQQQQQLHENFLGLISELDQQAASSLNKSFDQSTIRTASINSSVPQVQQIVSQYQQAQEQLSNMWTWSQQQSSGSSGPSGSR